MPGFIWWPCFLWSAFTGGVGGWHVGLWAYGKFHPKARHQEFDVQRIDILPIGTRVITQFRGTEYHAEVLEIHLDPDDNSPRCDLDILGTSFMQWLIKADDFKVIDTPIKLMTLVVTAEKRPADATKARDDAPSGD